jgi:hypothetical protein
MKHLLKVEEVQAQWRTKLAKQREVQEASNAALHEKRRRRNVEDRAGMGELTEARDALQAWAHERGLLHNSKYKTDEDFRAGMHNLTAYLEEMFQIHKGKIEKESFRYIEGFPVRDRIKRPSLLPGRLTGSARGKCLQCRVRQMRCSLEMLGVRGEACSVCRRHDEGDECCFWQDGESRGLAHGKFTKHVNGNERSFDATVRKWHSIQNKTKLDVVNGGLQEHWMASFALPRPQRWGSNPMVDEEDGGEDQTANV